MAISRVISYIKLNHHIYIIITCFVIAIFAATGINREVVGLGHDDGIYVILGKALSEGEGYRLINLPSSPYQAKYPVVYPFLISCVWPAGDFPDNIFYIKLINIFFLFLILLETYYICLALFDGKKNLSFYIVMLAGMSQWMLYFSINALSEIPFLFFSLTAALLFILSGKKQMQGRDNSVKYVFYFFAILSASLAYQTRTSGLALLMACVLYFLLKKSYKAAVLSLLLICALNLPWIIWAKAHAPSANSNPLLLYYTAYSLSTFGTTSVLELVSKLKVILFANISCLCKYVPEIISSISTMLKPLMALVWIIFLVGIRQCLKRGQSLFILLYLALYIMIYLSLPILSVSKFRYLVPLTPFFFMIFFMGIMGVIELAKNFRSKRPRVYFISFIAFLLLPNLAAGTKFIVLSDNKSWDGFKETISWIKKNTDQDAILACSYDPVYYLYTGRKGLRPWFENVGTYYFPSPKEAKPFVGDPGRSFDLLRDLKAGYLIQEPLGGPEGKPVMEFYSDITERYKDELNLVFVSKDQIHRIYQITSVKK